MITALCRSCGSPVYWLTNVKTGKKMPIDIEEGFRGNIKINLDDLTFELLPKGSPPSPDKHRSHFSTCPYAERHRK